MQVVNLDCADEAQVPLFDVLILWVSRAHLEQAVEVAAIDYAEVPLGLPLKARANQLKCLFVVQVVPAGAEEVGRQLHVDVAVGGLEDLEVLRLEVDVELIGEVR